MITSIALLINCSGKENLKIKNRDLSRPLTFSDSIWIKFSKAMEEKNIEFLLENSLDKIECTDCIVGSNIEDRFESKFIFEHHLNKLMVLDSLSKKEFSTSIHENRLLVNYTIVRKYAEGYNLIFEFQRSKEKYLFKKMYFVP